MKYLHLKFTNAGMIPPHENRHFKKSSNGVGKYDGSPKKKDEWTGYDMTCPIPYHVLSGVLAKLCGEIPVPTKRHTYFERISVLDDIAKNSYVYYNTKPITNEKGYIANCEYFQSSKVAHDSHKQTNTSFVSNDATVTYKGTYNWDYLRRSFGCEEDFKRVVGLLNELIDEDSEKLTFNEVYFKISSKWGEDDFTEKVNNFLSKEKKDFILKPWMGVLFGGNVASNTPYNSRTPLLLKNGISRIVYTSGDIICPIEDENVIAQLHENGGTATILEGGLVYIVGLENYPPIPNYERDFEKIFDENASQNTHNQELV